MSRISTRDHVKAYLKEGTSMRLVFYPGLVFDWLNLRRYDDKGKGMVYGLACLNPDPLELVLSAWLENVPVEGNKSEPVTVLDDLGNRYTGFTAYWPFPDKDRSTLRVERDTYRPGMPKIDLTGHPVDSADRHSLIRVLGEPWSRRWDVGEGRFGVNLRLEATATLVTAPVQQGFM